MRFVGADAHRLRHDSAEVVRVDVVGLGVQAVAGPGRFDRALGQNATKPKDVGLQGRGLVRRQPIRPQQVHEAVRRDDRAPLEHEGREQPPLSFAWWPGLVPGLRDPQRSEDPVPHVATPSTWLKSEL